MDTHPRRPARKYFVAEHQKSELNVESGSIYVVNEGTATSISDSVRIEFKIQPYFNQDKFDR